MSETNTKTVNCYELQWRYLRIRQKIRRHFKKRMAFFFSLLITYLLTIGLTVGSIVIQVDSINSKNLMQFNTSSTEVQVTGNGSDEELVQPDDADGTEAVDYEFYECKDLSVQMFIAAKMLETLVPTAITFSGTILILQTDPIKKRSLMVWLFVVIALLVVGGIVLPTAKSTAFLEAYLWALGALCLLSLILSWRAFSDPSVEEAQHKKESSDGKMVF